MNHNYIKQKKILLVDDERQLLDMVSDFLLEDGYTQIRTAGTVEKAIGTAKEWNPDFAILMAFPCLSSCGSLRRSRCCF